MFYSRLTGGFYPGNDRAEYEKYGDWPADAVEITDELYAEVVSNRPANKIIVADKNGLPALADPAAPTAAQITLGQIAELEATVTDRRIREAVLGIDTGWLKAVNDEIAKLRATLK